MTFSKNNWFWYWFINFAENNAYFNSQKIIKNLIFTNLIIISPSLPLLFFLKLQLGFGSIFFPFLKDNKYLGIYIIKDRFSMVKLIHIFNGNLISKKSNLFFAKWIFNYNYIYSTNYNMYIPLSYISHNIKDNIKIIWNYINIYTFSFFLLYSKSYSQFFFFHFSFFQLIFFPFWQSPNEIKYLNKLYDITWDFYKFSFGFYYISQKIRCYAPYSIFHLLNIRFGIYDNINLLKKIPYNKIIKQDIIHYFFFSFYLNLKITRFPLLSFFFFQFLSFNYGNRNYIHLNIMGWNPNNIHPFIFSFSYYLQFYNIFSPILIMRPMNKRKRNDMKKSKIKNIPIYKISLEFIFFPI